MMGLEGNHFSGPIVGKRCGSVREHLFHALDKPYCPKMTDTTYLNPSWCGLAWSAWVPFEYFHERRTALPAGPGVYRVRPVDDDCLMYIGQTGRTLRERLYALSGYRKTPDLMPYNDPHTAAPSLWAWRDATGMDFECSAAPLDHTVDVRMRETMECYLLWQYRREYGSSTLCNFGRFHPNYLKSRGRSSRERGGRLPEDRINPAGGPSLPPLAPAGSPSSPNWMGLHWNEPRLFDEFERKDVPRGPGLYRIMSAGDDDVVYIGQSADLGVRLSTHAKRDWGEIEAGYSYVVCSSDILPHQLKEWENDLIAGYYGEMKRAPVYQFSNR